MAELDFRMAPVAQVAHYFFANGCVLLRNFADPERLHSLIAVVDDLYAGKPETEKHLYPRDLAEQGLPSFHSHIFNGKHNDLLDFIFRGFDYHVSENTASRRIDSVAAAGQWMPPLGPHLDSFIHEFDFTINFWVPFRDCGQTAPSLAVARASFDEVVEFSGYDHGPTVGGHDGNFLRFNAAMPSMYRSEPEGVAHFRSVFADRIWTPSYRFGDAMMLSNWTLHFTHATPTMTEQRANIELRFVSNATLEAMLAAR